MVLHESRPVIDPTARTPNAPAAASPKAGAVAALQIEMIIANGQRSDVETWILSFRNLR